MSCAASRSSKSYRAASGPDHPGHGLEHVSVGAGGRLDEYLVYRGGSERVQGVQVGEQRLHVEDEEAAASGVHRREVVDHVGDDHRNDAARQVDQQAVVDSRARVGGERAAGHGGNEAEPAGAVDAPDADVGLLAEPEVGGPQACVDIVGDLGDLVRAELAGGERDPVERLLESLYQSNLAGLADSLNVVERGRAGGGCRAEPGLVDLDGDQPDRVDQVWRDVRAHHSPAGVGHLAERHGVNPSGSVLEHDPQEDQRVEGLGVDPKLDVVGSPRAARSSAGAHRA